MLKTRVDDQWLRGKLVNGAEGIFPKNFVEIVVSIRGLDETAHLVSFRGHFLRTGFSTTRATDPSRGRTA